MKKIRIIIFILLCPTLSGCSWISSFYIINDTNNTIIITYKLKPTSEDDDYYALKDTIEFFKLIKNEDGEIERKLSCNSPIQGKFIKNTHNNIEFYSVKIQAQTLVSSGQNLGNFSYLDQLKRHEIFNNLIEMTIIRNDTKDTLTLKKSMIADLSRPFGRHDIALIFD